MKNKRKQMIKISVFITSIFVIFLSITYAFINTTLTGTRRQVITTGNLELVLDEDENNLQIVDALPMYDEVGMLQEAFTFRLINKTSVNTDYILKLEDITVGEALSKDDVKYGLTKDDEVTIDLVSTITDEVIDQGTISGNTTIEYSLRLWIKDSITEIDTIQNKNLRFKMNIEAIQSTVVEIPKDSVSLQAFNEANLGEVCKTYDDGTDTFLVGQCQNNYVWYSGKLWRVVLKNNETGAVKMVTDNAITSISYNASENVIFENSYADQWLQQEFLPTLHDYGDYLVEDDIWDVGMDESDTPTKPTKETTVDRTVGLLNAYEYYTTYNNSDGLANNQTGYLNNDTYWWFINSYSSSRIRDVDSNGSLSHNTPTYTCGIRPTINLKSEIQILSGEGTQSNPYRLREDYKETINGTTLLNTRYSGEYIIFNNELYRIVEVENNLTKITSVDVVLNKPFHNINGIVNFNEANIKIDLENYYQGLNETPKNMIEPNTTWYLGKIPNGENYKTSICANVDIKTSARACLRSEEKAITNIALPRVGEMFTSQITRGEKITFWNLNPYSTARVREINTTGLLSNGNPVDTYGIRPSLYLKQNVVISKDNTGDGTYEHPYNIELGK